MLITQSCRKWQNCQPKAKVPLQRLPQAIYFRLHLSRLPQRNSFFDFENDYKQFRYSWYFSYFERFDQYGFETYSWACGSDSGTKCSESEPLTEELDEFWSFVGKKKNQRWMWLAIISSTRRIGAFVNGRRIDKNCRALLKKIWRQPCGAIFFGWLAFVSKMYFTRMPSHRQR